ncbi:hypothetical protein [Rubinisphaera sp.]|nr:hypothetical protein [Rubinisphaera sp.]
MWRRIGRGSHAGDKMELGKDYVTISFKKIVEKQFEIPNQR